MTTARHCWITFALTISGCTSAPTHWVDTTGLSRPDSQLQQAMATCTQQAAMVQQQQQAQLQNVAVGATNSRQALFLGLAASLTAAANAEIQYKLCLASAGWEKRTYVPSSPSTSDQSTVQVVAAARNIKIPTSQWREEPTGKIPDTLSFISNTVSRRADGLITAYVIMNYDSPNKMAFVGNVQSAMFAVSFRCDSYEAKALLIEFYTGSDASGNLLKQVKDHPIRVKPNSVEDKMRRHVCSAITHLAL